MTLLKVGWGGIAYAILSHEAVHIWQLRGRLLHSVGSFEELAEEVPVARCQRTSRAFEHRDREGEAASADLLRGKIDRHFQLGIGRDGRRQLVEITASGIHARHTETRAVAEENFRERLGDDRFDSPTDQRLRSMFARRPTTKVAASHKHASPMEADIVEWMLRILLAIIFKRMFAKTIERDATQEASGNDSVGIDVIEKERHAGAGDLGDRLHEEPYSNVCVFVGLM